MTQVVSVAGVPARSTALALHVYLIRWTLALSRSTRKRRRTKKSPPGGTQQPKPGRRTMAHESKHSNTKSKKKKNPAHKKKGQNPTSDFTSCPRPCGTKAVRIDPFANIPPAHESINRLEARGPGSIAPWQSMDRLVFIIHVVVDAMTSSRMTMTPCMGCWDRIQEAM